MWGLAAQLKELREENEKLKKRLKDSLAVNELRLDQIQALQNEILAMAEEAAGEDI